MAVCIYFRMKNKILLFVLTVVIFMSGNAQTYKGILNQGLTLKSTILSKEVRYSVYLPADYETNTNSYPVLYLLHGYTDNDLAWVQLGNADKILDKMIGAGEIPPMIVVMPDAGTSWYINNYNNTVRYEDFFIQEFIPSIESLYRIKKERKYRAVGGLSMGGFGSIVYSFRHPQLFGAVTAFSSAIYTDEQTLAKTDEMWARTEAEVYGPGLKGMERFTKHFKSYNPLYFVKEIEPASLDGLRIYLDCGDGDYLFRGNAQFELMLNEKKIKHEYRVRDGLHNWEYWQMVLPYALKFIAEGY